MHTIAADGRLTRDAAETFTREGYLIVEDLFTDADLQPVIDEIIDEVDRRAGELVKSGDLSQSYAEYGFEHRLAHISAETDKLARAIWNGILDGPAVFHLITHPRLLDLAATFCGDEIIASSVYRLRPKIPGYAYGAVPWHQDSGYLEPFCDDALILTVWLPLVDATRERGCLWVIPRAHRGGVAPHRVHATKSYLEIPDEDLPPGEWTCCPVRKGGVLLLTNRCPHASFDNETDIVRWSMDLRYQSAALPTNAPITRLPGDAVPGDTVPIACYPPEADFLVRSRLRPDEVVRDPAEFQRLRREHEQRPVSDRWGKWWERGQTPQK
ncbi:MAG: phytanoyl-CoA dioxygenase family protein [Armatimonadetes bacterium]|nr:phytanoyl-CoA dioxygenase family protein [Armatimonadota bacterium]